MQSLRDAVAEYRAAGKAIGHFNFSDSNQLLAIAEAAKETGLPVIAGLSEGEREYFPLSHARALIDVYQAQGVPLYLNADHTYSVEKVERAISAGVDSVVVDGAKLPFDENARMLSACVARARASGRDVLVEGELGYIGTSSQVLDELPEGAAATEELMTKPDELARLVSETGIDLVAPAVGNVHGMVKSGQPKLSIARIGELAKTAGVPLVHINTELRVLYRDALRESLAGEDTTPYKFLRPAVERVQAYLAQKMRLFAQI